MRSDRSGQVLVAFGGLLGFALVGWTALLVPALIRQIEEDLGVSDAAMGSVFLLGSVAFATGCLIAGWAVPRVGRRAVLLGSIAIVILGLLGVLVDSWPVFLLAAGLRGLGSGSLEVAIQGLFLQAFPGRQSRAINMVHFCYSAGAALAPIAIAGLVGAGAAWPVVVAGTTIPWLVVAAALAIAPMEARAVRGIRIPAARLRLSVALVAACIAIAMYVAAESGISSWLVRFLDSAPLSVAAGALTLFWAALAVGRLVAARYGDRYNPAVLAIGGLLIAGVSILAAVFVPSVPLAIAMFGVAGFAFGPVYPAIILLGGRIPGRTDAVTGIIAASSVVGSIVYPPLMGVIAEGPGMGIAMAGTALLSFGGALLVVVAAQSLRSMAGRTGTAAGSTVVEAA